MSTKYTQLKEITLQTILDLEESLFRAECLTRLTNCGFIGEVKASYRRGQHFKYNENEYVLSCFDYQKAALVNIRTGSSWSGLHPIENSPNITQAEFDVLCSGVDPKLFQLVEK